MHLFDEAATASNLIALASSGKRAEGAHGVDEQMLAVALRQFGDLRNRVEYAGSGFALDRENVGDGLVACQHRLDGGEIGRRVFGRLKYRDTAAGNFADFLGALAVGAVDQQQHLAVARDEGREHRLDRERAGALHRHGHEIHRRHSRSPAAASAPTC